MSPVILSLSGQLWHQQLFRGYSAELFGRTLDYFLGAAVARWKETEAAWIHSEVNGVSHKLKHFLGADDVVLLATSLEQARRPFQQERRCPKKGPKPCTL